MLSATNLSTFLGRNGEMTISLAEAKAGIAKLITKAIAVRLRKDMISHLKTEKTNDY
jgi:hypothetical protein